MTFPANKSSGKTEGTERNEPPGIKAVVRRLAATLYLPVFLIQVGAGMLVPILPVALRDNGLSYQMVTVVLSAVGIGALVSQIPIGRILIRRSENDVMIACVVMLAIVTGSLGLTSGALALASLRFFSGIGSTGWLLSRQTFVTRTVDASVRGRAMSLFGGLNRVAAFLGPLLGGVLAEASGYRLAFFVAGGFTAAGMLPLLFDRAKGSQTTAGTGPGGQQAHGGHKPSDGRASTDAPATHSEEIRTHPLAVFAKHRRTLSTAGAVQMCVIAVRYGRFIILPLVGDAIGLGPKQIGLLISIGAAADMLFFPAAGYLMDRFGRLAAIVPSFTLLGVGLLFLAGSESYATILASATLIGVGNGMGAGTMMTLASDLAPEERPGEFLAALGTIREIGRTVGPLGVGYLADRFSLGTASFALAMVAFLGVIVMIFGVGETARPTPQLSSTRS